MSEPGLPQTREVIAQLRKMHLVVSAPAVAVIVAYLWLLLDLGGTSWFDLGASIALYAVIVGIINEIANRRLLVAVAAYFAFDNYLGTYAGLVA